MLRARTKGGTVILGLSAENVKRLRAGQPMHFSLADIGIDQDIVMLYGETEAAIAEQLNTPPVNTNARKPQ